MDNLVSVQARPSEAPLPSGPELARGLGRSERRRHAGLWRHGSPVSRSRHALRAHGFTLLEMLVVIALIGLASVAVAVSVSNGLASARVRAASAELAGALRATRAQAIVRGRDEVFDVDTRTNRYAGAMQREVALPRGLQASITSAKEDRPNDHTGRIRFFPDGSSTGGRITLKAGQREWHINVSWLTGEVRVVDTVAAR